MKRLLVVTILILLGCAKEPGKKVFAPVDLSPFGPTTTDAKINRDAVKKRSGSEMLLRPSGELYAEKSEDILEIAETLLDLAENSRTNGEKQAYRDLSESIHGAFYNNPKNYTTFNATNATYLELALGLAYEPQPGDNSQGLKDLIFKGMSQSLQRLEAVLKQIGVFKPAPQTNKSKNEAPDIGFVLKQFEIFLAGVPERLSSKSIQPPIESKIIAGIDTKLRTEYLPMIRETEAKIAHVGMAQEPEQNISALQDAIKGFTMLDPEFIGPLVDELNGARALVEKMRKPQNTDQMFDLFLTLWEDPAVGPKAFEGQSQMLYNFLNKLTPEQRTWLRRYNLDIDKVRSNTTWKRKWNSFKVISIGGLPTAAVCTDIDMCLVYEMEVIKAGVWLKEVEDVRTDLLNGLNRKLLETFDSKLRSSNVLLTTSINNLILKNVNSAFDGYRAGLKEIVREEGKKLLNEIMFSENPNFVGIESSQVALVSGRNGRFSTKINASEGERELVSKAGTSAVVTSAETLGRALALQSKRLKLMDEDGRVDKHSLKYWEEVFVPINKLMAIGGFQYMEKDKPRFAGIFRKVFGETSGDYDMDMFNYDLEGSTFAVPESVIVKSNFNVQTQLTRQAGLVATVEGNSEIMRGGALMMYYFRDWQRNGFDVSMGQKKYKETTVEIFPKHAFYALSMGIGSVPLRNLTRAGLVGFGNSGRQYESEALATKQDNTTMECPASEGLKDPRFPEERPDPVIAVALTNLTPRGRGDVVKSADIARFIMAADQFVVSTDGIEETKARPLQKEVDGFKRTMKAIKCGRKSVKQLMLGLANFLTSRMQYSDGGFARYYSISNKKIVSDIKILPDTGDLKKTETRYLEDQVLILQALRKVYDRWRGEAYKHVAVDGYHFLNRNLFDEELGFYRQDDQNVPQKTVDLRLMAMTLKAFDAMEPLLPDSDREQFEFLRAEWSKKLTEFAAHIKN